MKFIKIVIQNVITGIIVRLAQWVSKLELNRRNEIFNKILINTFDLPKNSRIMEFPTVTIVENLYIGENLPVPAISLNFVVNLQKSVINTSQALQRHLSIIQENVRRCGYSRVGINIQIDIRCAHCDIQLNHLKPFPFECPGCHKDLQVKCI